MKNFSWYQKIVERRERRRGKGEKRWGKRSTIVGDVHRIVDEVNLQYDK